MKAFESELDSLADNMRAILKYYQGKRGYMAAVVLTSDAMASRVWGSSAGPKVDWLFMWNLSRKDLRS